MKWLTGEVVLLCLGAFLIGFSLAGAIWGDSYRSGQIDALTGKYAYHLVVKPDSTRVWEKGKPDIIKDVGHSVVFDTAIAADTFYLKSYKIKRAK